MNNKDRRDLNAGLREDLATFIRQTFHTVAPGDIYHHNWHIDAIAWHLQQCAIGEIKRLVITVPPRNLKSICASVAFPAWVLGRNPSQRIITASYSAELAGKLARDCRMVMESRWYQEALPPGSAAKRIPRCTSRPPGRDTDTRSRWVGRLPDSAETS
jgi:hypothetical protein